MAREFFLKDPLHPKGGITIKARHDDDCVFCEHCAAVFWDYENLIYMILCEEEHEPWEKPCKYFKEESEAKT